MAIELLAANASSDWLSTDGDVQLVYDVLAAGVGEANANPAHGRSTSYNIAYLIKALADSKRLGSGKLVHLEWSYFGMLEHQAQHDLVIYQQLISDPELLLELLALIYKPEGETRECFPEPSATERAVATHSWRILNEWKPFACASPDSMPQAGALLDFVGRVREKAAEWHHTRVADYHLGVAMASAPAGTDGVWPHESVREVLERYHSESLADGFVVGRANLVGITSRAPGDGGEQERGDAVQYEAWQRALAARNPRTSSLLGRLAEDRRAEATWEDAQDRIR